MKESEIQSQILIYLRANNIFCWKNHVGGIKTKYGMATNPAKGIADITGVMPGGRFLACEVKTPKGKPSPEQILYLANVNAAGGLGFFATSVEDVAHELTGVFKLG